MKKILVMTAVASTMILLFASVSMATFINPNSGDGVANNLQNVLDGLVRAPSTPPLVDASGVVNDALASDAYWQIQGSGGSVSTFIIQITGYVQAGFENVGIFDKTDPNNRVELFASGSAPGTQVLISILADGSVLKNLVDTGKDFGSINVFGFYLDVAGSGLPTNTWFSDDSLNADLNDHMVAFQGNGKTIQIGPLAAGIFGSDEYIFAFEDLGWTPPGSSNTDAPWGAFNGGPLSDRDYNDTVFLVESINNVSVPEPGILILLGIALSAVGVFSHRIKF